MGPKKSIPITWKGAVANSWGCKKVRNLEEVLAIHVSQAVQYSLISSRIDGQ